MYYACQLRDLGSKDDDATYLSSSCLGVFLLDLNFANIAGMLDDFGNVRLVSSSDLARDSLCQVCEATVHPVLPEDADAIAERRKVGCDHTEGAVDGPEEEEDDEQVMGVPEALEVSTSRFLRCCQRNCHQRDQHDITTPAWTSSKIS